MRNNKAAGVKQIWVMPNWYRRYAVSCMYIEDRNASLKDRRKVCSLNFQKVSNVTEYVTRKTTLPPVFKGSVLFCYGTEGNFGQAPMNKIGWPSLKEIMLWVNVHISRHSYVVNEAVSASLIINFILFNCMHQKSQWDI